jgi:hypothetical protein
MNLPDQLYNLIKEVENQLSKLPPNEFLFGFPISDKPRRRKQRRQCFIIGPYRKWFTKVTKIIFKAATKEGFKCEISRDLRRPGQIIDQVWQGIRRAEVIIADVTPETVKNKVTKENPNVYYELGLSHALGKQTIIISQDLDILPFDVRNMRKIPYNRNNLKQLEKELRLAFQEIERRYDYDK